MASLLLRHRTRCALGGGRFTAAKPEGCTCKPGFYGVLDMGERITLKATNLRDAERELVQKMEQRSAGDDPARNWLWRVDRHLSRRLHGARFIPTRIRNDDRLRGARCASRPEGSP